MGRTAANVTIPEAEGLTWRDTFFDNEQDVIAVFDYDYETIEKFRNDVACISLVIPPFCCIVSLCCYPCFYKQQISWDVYSKHVCVTQDGIKYVQDKRKTMCGLAFQDEGKTSKTVPFDKITDCDVTEPAGATCLCVDNVLHVVNVDTASGSRGGGEDGPQHELSLYGLEKPHELKKLAWAMKRAQAAGGVGVGVGAATPQSSIVQTQAPTAGKMNDRGDHMAETNEILQDIRKELQELNKHLRKQTSKH